MAKEVKCGNCQKWSPISWDSEYCSLCGLRFSDHGVDICYLKTRSMEEDRLQRKYFWLNMGFLMLFLAFAVLDIFWLGFIQKLFGNVLMLSLGFLLFGLSTILLVREIHFKKKFPEIDYFRKR